MGFYYIIIIIKFSMILYLLFETAYGYTLFCKTEFDEVSFLKAGKII